MKKFLYKLWSKFLTGFGDIKVFRFPFWVVYDPNYFKMSGEKILEVAQIIKPGDIILRGFDYYADGKLINGYKGYSHGAIYAGNNTIIHAVAEGVSEINLVDFCECDRIAIFRPKKGQKTAVKNAKTFLKNKTPYDFGFQKGVSALYCFELCGEAYAKLNIPRYTVSKCFGLVKRQNVLLAKSFFESYDMECIFEYNPKHNVNYVSEKAIED